MIWQPIATAPKGDSIIIYRKSGRICIASYDSQPYHKKASPYWNDYGVFGTNNMREDAPTHWMPLPEAPKP